MKINYASVVDWYWRADILRTNPNFHNRPRFDFALVQINGNQCIFVQLIFLFSVEFNGCTLGLALVLPLDVPRSLTNQPRDVRLQLTRVQPQHRSSSVVIDTKLIVRGALLTRDLMSENGEYLVVDSIDEYFCLRLKSVELVQNAHL